MSKVRAKRKQFRFWFHYNKPMSRQMDMAVWTVHWRNKCWHALNIKCSVDTETHARNSQPHAVVRGFAHTLEMAGPLPEKDTLFTTAYIDADYTSMGAPTPCLIVELSKEEMAERDKHFAKHGKEIGK